MILCSANRRCGILKRGISCTQTRLWSARIADRNSLLLPVSRNFMRKKGSRMNRSAAKPVARLVRTQPAEPMATARCLTLSALPAAKLARFPLSLTMTVRSTAAIVLKTISNLSSYDASRNTGRIFSSLRFWRLDLEFCVFLFWSAGLRDVRGSIPETDSATETWRVCGFAHGFWIGVRPGEEFPAIGKMRE